MAYGITPINEEKYKERGDKFMKKIFPPETPNYVESDGSLNTPDDGDRFKIDAATKENRDVYVDYKASMLTKDDDGNYREKVTKVDVADSWFRFTADVIGLGLSGAQSARIKDAEITDAALDKRIKELEGHLESIKFEGEERVRDLKNTRSPLIRKNAWKAAQNEYSMMAYAKQQEINKAISVRDAKIPKSAMGKILRSPGVRKIGKAIPWVATALTIMDAGGAIDTTIKYIKDNYGDNTDK